MLIDFICRVHVFLDKLGDIAVVSVDIARSCGTYCKQHHMDCNLLSIQESKNVLQGLREQDVKKKHIGTDDKDCYLHSIYSFFTYENIRFIDFKLVKGKRKLFKFLER